MSSINNGENYNNFVYPSSGEEATDPNDLFSTQNLFENTTRSNVPTFGDKLGDKLKNLPKTIANLPHNVSYAIQPENQMNSFATAGNRIKSFYSTVYKKFEPVRNVVASPFSKIDRVARILAPVEAEEGKNLTAIQKVVNVIKKVISVQDNISAKVGEKVQDVCFILNAIPLIGSALQVVIGFTARAATTVAFAAFDLAVAATALATAAAAAGIALTAVAGAGALVVGLSPLYSGPAIVYLLYRDHQREKQMNQLNTDLNKALASSTENNAEGSDNSDYTFENLPSDETQDSSNNPSDSEEPLHTNKK